MKDVAWIIIASGGAVFLMGAAVALIIQTVRNRR